MIWRAFFAALLKPLLSLVSWFGGRKSAQADIKLEVAERSLEVVQKAKEIENEVEVLSPDALRIRSRIWVRKHDR